MADTVTISKEYFDTLLRRYVQPFIRSRPPTITDQNFSILDLSFKPKAPLHFLNMNLTSLYDFPGFECAPIDHCPSSNAPKTTPHFARLSLEVVSMQRPWMYSSKEPWRMLLLRRRPHSNHPRPSHIHKPGQPKQCHSFPSLASMSCQLCLLARSLNVITTKIGSSQAPIVPVQKI